MQAKDDAIATASPPHDCVAEYVSHIIIADAISGVRVRLKTSVFHVCYDATEGKIRGACHYVVLLNVCVHLYADMTLDAQMCRCTHTSVWFKIE